jgi:hypothetical protein
MDIEALKKSWETIDHKINNSALLHYKLVETIISSRVTSTVDRIKTLNKFFYITLVAEAIFLVALFLGNPFDFSYTIQYVPYGILLAGVITAFLNLVKISQTLQRASARQSVGDYIQQIVDVYNRNKKFERWFGMIFLGTGLTIPLSFIPQKIDRLGLNQTILDVGIMTGVTLVIYIIAIWLGFFQPPYKKKLELDLKEWNELKDLAKEFSDQRTA